MEKVLVQMKALIRNRPGNRMPAGLLCAGGWAVFVVATLWFFSAHNVFAAMLTSGNASSEDHRSSQVNLRLTLRELLLEKTFLIQRYIVSECADLADTGVVLRKLFDNEEGFVKTLGHYLGEASVVSVDKISKERISCLVGLTNAFAPGDTERLEKILSNCREKNEKLAEALCTANPGWQKQLVRDFFDAQIESVRTHVLARAAADWQADIQHDDRDREEARKFADMLADGIIERFPEKFKQ